MIDHKLVDLNEEFSALHVPTLLDQAQYVKEVILFLKKSYNRTSFPLVLHSMGGIVARQALIDLFLFETENEQSAEKWKLFTMATPHKQPPVLISRALSEFYQNLKKEWSELKSKPEIFSFAGGSRDTTVNSEFCKVSAEEGHSYYTVGMDYVWTSAEHNALLWCNQFVKRLATFVVELNDSKGFYKEANMFFQSKSSEFRLELDSNRTFLQNVDKSKTVFASKLISSFAFQATSPTLHDIQFKLCKINGLCDRLEVQPQIIPISFSPTDPIWKTMYWWQLQFKNDGFHDSDQLIIESDRKTDFHGKAIYEHDTCIHHLHWSFVGMCFRETCNQTLLIF